MAASVRRRLIKSVLVRPLLILLPEQRDRHTDISTAGTAMNTNPLEVSANEAAIALRERTSAIIALVQSGGLQGRYDPTRPATTARWFVSRSDLERELMAPAERKA